MHARNDIAFGLFCQLTEASTLTVHPEVLHYSEQAEGYQHLVALGALQPGEGIGTHLLCPWCHTDELREIHFHASCYQGYCTECGWVTLPGAHVKPLQVNVRRLVQWLALALGLTKHYHCQELIPESLWRLGEIEHRRKRRTVFFARRLFDSALTSRMEKHLCNFCAPGCGIVITTTQENTVATTTSSHRIVPLPAIAHLRKSGVVIENIHHYLEEVATPRTPTVDTSLRLMHTGRVALIEGQPHALSPQVWGFLCVLEKAQGQPVHKRTLADALDMDVDRCKGAAIFKRHKSIYTTFVAHDGDGHYWLKSEFLNNSRR